MDKMKVRKLAAAIECLGIGIASVGVGLELAYGGALHLVIITAGAVIIAVGSLLYAKVT